MKIRTGFVSNSSSASFICIKCKDVHDVEVRCGGPETEKEWIEATGQGMPTAGICEGCREEWTPCSMCARLNEKDEEFLNVGHADSVDVGGGMYDWSDHTCIDCIVESLEKCDFDRADLSGWRKKISNPDYVMTESDKKLAEALLQHKKEVTS